MPLWHQFHFLRPVWLLALLPLAILLLWLLRHKRDVNDWRRLCDPPLLEQLLVQQPSRQRRRWLALLALGWLLAIVALAGPTWQKRRLPLYQNQAGRVVVLDLSRSMLAGDLQPSRLARARFKISDLLAQGDIRTGLVVYAGAAFTVVPLTSDAATIEHLLPVLTPDLMPAAGNRPAPALAMAGRLLTQAGVRHGQIILIASQADSAAVRTAARLHRRGQRIAVLGVGTLAGAPIPNGSGGFVNDTDGHPRLARLDLRGLQAVARAGGGRYTELSADDSDIRTLVADQPHPRAGSSRTLGSSGWLESGSWLVLLLLPLAALGFRRGWLLALVLLVPLPRPAAAWDWASLWQRPDQQAYQALRAHRPKRAEALAQHPRLRGTAAYQAGDYAAAAAAFAQVDGPDADYNRGNALAHLGHYRRALQAYDQALAAAPAMADARANRALVERLLRERQRQQQQTTAGSGNRNAAQQHAERHISGRKSHRPAANGQADGAANRPGNPNGRTASERAGNSPTPGGHSKPRSAAADRLDWEQQQALEQWLRRIPDDPGGLLRRKFRQQYQERRAAAAGRTE